MSAVNRGAIIDLIREAEMLGSMRHPNIVWVYGEPAGGIVYAARPMDAHAAHPAFRGHQFAYPYLLGHSSSSHPYLTPPGIVLPPLTGDPTAHGSSLSESPSSASPDGSGDAESAAIDAAINAAQGGEDAQPGNGGSPGREGKGGGTGGSKESKDVVDAIASGMQRSGMQPGMVRPPAMVTGGRGGGWCWVSEVRWCWQGG